MEAHTTIRRGVGGCVGDATLIKPLQAQLLLPTPSSYSHPDSPGLFRRQTVHPAAVLA